MEGPGTRVFTPEHADLRRLGSWEVRMVHPHYQRAAAVARRCRAAGLIPAGRHGSWRFYTANFRRPANRELLDSPPGVLPSPPAAH